MKSRNRFFWTALCLILSHTAFGQIAEGYYRVESTYYPTRSISEDAQATALNTATNSDTDFSQIWYITTNSLGKVKFQNAISSNYIRNNAGTSAQFRTNAFDNNNTFTATLVSGNTYTFQGSQQGLHCAATQSYKIVGWTTSADASKWTLRPVTIDENALQAAKDRMALGQDISKNLATYNTKLQTYFADNACTQLRPDFASLSEEELRTQMKQDELPDVLIDVAVRVLKDQWDADETRNKYTKFFRIQDIQIYSNNSKWATITGVGPWAELVNPTGIQANSGDFLLVFVENDPIDKDATLIAQIAYDTDVRSAGNTTLKKGLNLVQMPQDGELFIGYTLNNTDRYLSEYPTIRVHVELGDANGYWDMSRKMTNLDWNWLRQNMLKGKFLHLKGNSTVLNVLRSNVTSAADITNIMKGWDFQFEKMEYLIGNDGQWDGRYRPVLNARHSYQGNPNWSGYGGSNHPTISSSHLFNYNNFYEGNIWEIIHEVGHGHQKPINVAGATEISNNSLSQMVSYMIGRCYSRGDGTQKLIQLFNYERDGKRHWSWTDYSRYATPYYDASLHVGNQMLYKLYLYFEVMGHCPGFMPRLYDELRSNPIKLGNSLQSPTYYYNDYFRLAEACAKVSNTDLWEFFEVHGFWRYYDEAFSTADKDNDAQGIRFIGDYGGYYMKVPVRGNQTDERRIEDLKAYMHSLPNKAPNVMFLDDRINTSFVSSTSFVAQVKRALVGKPLLHYWDLPSQGDFGHYTNFDDKDRTANLSYTIDTDIATQSMTTNKGGEWNYTISGRTVRMKGSGILGIKLYDQDGTLAYLANTRNFIVPVEIAEGLEQGTYKLYVAATADKDIELGSDGQPTSIFENKTEALEEDAPLRDLQGRIVPTPQPGQIYIRAGKKVFVK